MTLDYSRLRSVTARQLVSALQSDGFRLDRQKGSHRRYVHADGRAVTISYHRPSDTYAPKTLRSIIEVQAGWDNAVLERLGLLR
jgi:predicted RNA binding protein YcfA (HicA-like mRNA interferase family)